jgi:hypothetical protein
MDETTETLAPLLLGTRKNTRALHRERKQQLLAKIQNYLVTMPLAFSSCVPEKNVSHPYSGTNASKRNI